MVFISSLRLNLPGPVSLSAASLRRMRAWEACQVGWLVTAYTAAAMPNSAAGRQPTPPMDGQEADNFVRTGERLRVVGFMRSAFDGGSSKGLWNSESALKIGVVRAGRVPPHGGLAATRSLGTDPRLLSR